MVQVLEEAQNNKMLHGHLVQRETYLNLDKLKGIIY